MGNCMFLRKGETHTKPLTGILASDLAVGSTVKLMENGSAVEYLVVNQGIPSASSLYDSSCDGTWLLRKDIYTTRAWNSSSNNNFSTSSMKTYLNDTFYNLFGDIEKTAIRLVTIPYARCNGTGTIYSGENGVACNVFLLSGYEVGFTTSQNSTIPKDGAILSYFTSGIGTTAKQLRIAYLDGTATIWLTRSGTTDTSNSIWSVNASGSYASTAYSNSRGVRPALILPSAALFDKNTLILKGVA